MTRKHSNAFKHTWHAHTSIHLCILDTQTHQCTYENVKGKHINTFMHTWHADTAPHSCTRDTANISIHSCTRYTQTHQYIQTHLTHKHISTFMHTWHANTSIHSCSCHMLQMVSCFHQRKLTPNAKPAKARISSSTQSIASIIQKQFVKLISVYSDLGLQLNTCFNVLFVSQCIL